MSLDSNDAEDQERRLPLPDCGQRVSIESPRHKQKLWTQMIGFKPGHYVIFEKPHGHDGIEGPLRDGDSLVIRFLKDGTVFGFRTPVLHTMSIPYQMLFVAYPVEVLQHSLRSSPRLQCYLPCEGEVGGRIFSRAFIRDFSATGCQLRIPLDALAEEEAPSGFALAEQEAPSDAALAEQEASSGGAALGEPDAAGSAAPVAGEAAPSAVDGDSAPLAAGSRVTINLRLPGEPEDRVASGEVLEWQTQPRFHVVRAKFDEPQQDLFDQLSLYTTQLG
ncbi:MAG TPA: flagellar brake protein [Gammaproteobacteria bacterium]|nr:flagellar brake protein [Gammaproteobacteria bacterium]